MFTEAIIVVTSQILSMLEFFLKKIGIYMQFLKGVILPLLMIFSTMRTQYITKNVL